MAEHRKITEKSTSCLAIEKSLKVAGVPRESGEPAGAFEIAQHTSAIPFDAFVFRSIPIRHHLSEDVLLSESDFVDQSVLCRTLHLAASRRV